MSRPFHAAAAGSNVSLAQLSVEQLRMRSTGHIFDASSIVADAERNGDMDKGAHLRLTDRMVKLIVERREKEYTAGFLIVATESCYIGVGVWCSNKASSKTRVEQGGKTRDCGPVWLTLIDVILETIRRQDDLTLSITDVESAYEIQTMGHGQLVVRFWLAASGASEDGLMLVEPLRRAVQAAHDRGERVTTARVDLETRKHALETLRADLSS